MESVPPRMKRKAQLLINHVKNSPQLQWTKKGQLMYRGQVLENTNIADLVNDMLRKRKHFEPQGWQTFAQALKETNVPQDLIGHQERWNWMQRTPTSSTLPEVSLQGRRPPQREVRELPSWVPY